MMPYNSTAGNPSFSLHSWVSDIIGKVMILFFYVGLDRELERVSIMGISGIPDVRRGNDLVEVIIKATKNQGISILDKDIIVVTQKIVSKAEGRLLDLKRVTPSSFASRLGRKVGKDPRVVEAILREARRIVRMDRDVIIAETRHRLVCANAGVDQSNVHADTVSLLPINPDRSAQHIREGLKRRLNVDVVVIISDTFGRPWREGLTDVAIGVAGLKPLLDYRGKRDPYGYELRVTAMAIADELASAAELVMGKTSSIPVAIIRGYSYPVGEGSGQELIRPRERDLFR